jgi:hypothetical protein
MTDATVLDRMDRIDLLGHSLDLGRPELSLLMDRYLSEPDQRPPQLAQPIALIVAHREGQDRELKRAFRGAGWSIKSCAGPGKRDCPLVRNEACALRQSSDAAVVYVDPSEPAGAMGMLPRLRCAVDSSSPAVLAMEGRIDPPHLANGTATIGSLRPADSIVRTASELLALVRSKEGTRPEGD